MDNEIKKDLASNWFKLLQNAICNDISRLEKNKIKFKSTFWQRSKDRDEGGGEYRIIKNGKVFEKVGVNFSKVYGKFPKKFQKNIHHTIFYIFYNNFYCDDYTFFLKIDEICFFLYHL